MNIFTDQEEKCLKLGFCVCACVYSLFPPEYLLQSKCLHICKLYTTVFASPQEKKFLSIYVTWLCEGFRKESLSMDQMHY